MELEDNRLPSIFNRRVTLTNRIGTASQIAKWINELVPLHIEVEATETNGKEKQKRMRINYDGKLSNLLNTVCEYFGMGWEYDELSGKVEIARLQTKSFNLAVAPGNIKYESTITNKSQTSGSSSDSSSMEGVSQTTKTSDSVSQTSQTNKASFEGNVWKDTEKSIEAMLSKDGRVVVNEAAGMVTVTDTATVLHRVDRYIKSLNTKMGRQVALAVKVWALEMNRNADVGFDIESMLKAGQSSFSMIGGQPYTTLSGAGTLTAAILDGNWKDTKLMLRALKQRGRTTPAYFRVRYCHEQSGPARSGGQTRHLPCRNQLHHHGKFHADFRADTG